MSTGNSTLDTFAKPVPAFNAIQLASFFSFVDTQYGGDSGTCWKWTGASAKGYGVFLNFKATRVMWRIHYGTSPDSGLMCCHHCDDPICVNPTHLFLGTNQDNQLDASAKGRLCRLQGETNPACKLTDAQCDELRLIYQEGVYTQRALGHKFGLSQTQVSRIICGKGRGGPDISKQPILYDFGNGPERTVDAACRFGINANKITQRMLRGYCPPCAATLPHGGECPHRHLIKKDS